MLHSMRVCNWISHQTDYTIELLDFNSCCAREEGEERISNHSLLSDTGEEGDERISNHSLLSATGEEHGPSRL